MGEVENVEAEIVKGFFRERAEQDKTWFTNCRDNVICFRNKKTKLFETRNIFTFSQYSI